MLLDSNYTQSTMVRKISSTKGKKKQHQEKRIKKHFLMSNWWYFSFMTQVPHCNNYSLHFGSWVARKVTCATLWITGQSLSRLTERHTAHLWCGDTCTACVKIVMSVITCSGAIVGLRRNKNNGIRSNIHKELSVSTCSKYSVKLP